MIEVSFFKAFGPIVQSWEVTCKVQLQTSFNCLFAYIRICNFSIPSKKHLISYLSSSKRVVTPWRNLDYA
ncbi:hypothetical protein AQUCO_00600273v1 [Aquilegia coerulea]|uniref:Uncharacterized protein n=1 Tax=Aquilegia coerulea TaxID=218851 RepID=A0A2G5ENV9_AQUCA|nr:hypothetical protein AQUCO_00600273v1 [Aquilegia coerulea]